MSAAADGDHALGGEPPVPAAASASASADREEFGEVGEGVADAKASSSAESDDGDDGDDDEEFRPNSSWKKRQKKSAARDGEDGDSEGDTEGTPPKDATALASRLKRPPGPRVSGGFIDFPLAPVHTRLICTLCMGYFRDPYTIAECLHTFCKSCLFFAFRSGFRRCPECETSLEPDPFKEALSDRTMQTLVDKIFPHLKEKDERDEREFYARRGIKMKKEFLDEAEGSRKSVSSASGAASQSLSRGDGDKKRKHVPDDELEFVVVPDENVERDYQMPPVQMPKLRASGRLKVSNLKRYLLKKLQLKASPASVEICCNGDPLGDELSLTFINRTRWLDPSEEVQLTYRFGEEGMF